MATKQELIDALRDAVGGTAYGDYIVSEAAETYGDKSHKYGQGIKDRLDERIGLLKAYERIHRAAGEDAKAVAEEEKIAISEKALAAVEKLDEE